LIKFTATVLGPGDIQKVHDPVNEEKEAEEVYIYALLKPYFILYTYILY
jgi:hypothetical protein